MQKKPKKHGRFGNFGKLKILMALVELFFWGGGSKLIFKEKIFLTNEYNIPQSYVFYA